MGPLQSAVTYIETCLSGLAVTQSGPTVNAHWASLKKGLSAGTHGLAPTSPRFHPNDRWMDRYGNQNSIFSVLISTFKRIYFWMIFGLLRVGCCFAHIVETYDSAYQHSDVALYQSDLPTESDREQDEQAPSRVKRLVEDQEAAHACFVCVCVCVCMYISLYCFLGQL